MGTYIRFAAASDGALLGLKTEASVDEVVDRWRTSQGAPFEVERSSGRGGRAFVNPALIAFVVEENPTSTSAPMVATRPSPRRI